MKKILSVLILFMFLFSCDAGFVDQADEKSKSSGSGNSSDQIEKIPLSLKSKNTITKGNQVFEDVLAKYQPVIDFYGEDAETFRDLVNTLLLANSDDKLYSIDEKSFSYNSLEYWGDTIFIVEYADGTTEELPAYYDFTKEESVDTTPKWIIEGKEVVSICVKGKNASKYYEYTLKGLATINDISYLIAMNSGDITTIENSLKVMSD